MKVARRIIGKFSYFSNEIFISFTYDWVDWEKGLEYGS